MMDVITHPCKATVGLANPKRLHSGDRSMDEDNNTTTKIAEIFRAFHDVN